jgi:hypothetical protein
LSLYLEAGDDEVEGVCNELRDRCACGARCSMSECRKRWTDRAVMWLVRNVIQSEGVLLL